MKEYEKLLQRQIRKAGFSVQELERLAPFLDAVNESYLHYAADHVMLTRSLDISSNELHEKNQKLELKTEMLDQFIYRITHDLKSPVNNVVALTGMLMKLESGKEGMSAEVARKIQDSAKNLLDRIGELLEVARAEQAIQPDAVHCHLPTLLNGIVEQMSEKIHQTGASIHIDLATAPELYFPARNIESILHNLVSNALKYSRTQVPPEVQISSRPWDNGVQLMVKDNGMGMDLAKIGPKLFGLFNRFHSHVEGTGVGLYLVKKMTEENGGRLELSSTPGEGSEFRLFLRNYSSSDQ